jgi:hypothetical protein
MYLVVAVVGRRDGSTYQRTYPKQVNDAKNTIPVKYDVGNDCISILVWIKSNRTKDNLHLHVGTYQVDSTFHLHSSFYYPFLLHRKRRMSSPYHSEASLRKAWQILSCSWEFSVWAYPKKTSLHRNLSVSPDSIGYLCISKIILISHALCTEGPKVPHISPSRPQHGKSLYPTGIAVELCSCIWDSFILNQ